MSTQDDDGEFALIAVALSALSHLCDRQALQRALDYIANRLCEHERGEFLRNPLRDLPKPMQYIHRNNLDERFICREEVVTETGHGFLEVIEVCGVAIVSQQFAVDVPIGDGEGGMDGRETMWFATRAKAEMCVDQMRGDPEVTEADPNV